MARISLYSPIKLAMYKFIVSFKKMHDGNSPTVRQIGLAVGIRSASVVHYHLGKMEEMGLIRRENGTIQVTGGQWIAPANQPSQVVGA
jgi:SOS-response transcriptional repressor LexA